MDEDHAYRAMDLLVDADSEAKVQEAVFFACADLLNLEVDLLFFDTTSTYFERDVPDEAGPEDQPALRVYGHSKDHRPDLPQIVIGVAVTREGIPGPGVVLAGKHRGHERDQRGQRRFAGLLLFPWVCHRPGRGGHSPPRQSIASAMTASGEL